MSTVYRYGVPVDDLAHRFELSGPIVHVGTRRADVVEFWAVADKSAAQVIRWFQVIGTGHAIPEPAKGVVGTAVVPGGALVWHLVELDGMTL